MGALNILTMKLCC